jgi:hypothetical protein
MNLRRLIGFNLLTGLVLGFGGYFLGWWLGHRIHGPSIAYFADTGQNDIALFIAYLLGVVGFLVGLGFANYPLQRCSASRRRCARRRRPAGRATSASAPTTRWSASSTCSASARSHSSAA